MDTSNKSIRVSPEFVDGLSAGSEICHAAWKARLAFRVIPIPLIESSRFRMAGGMIEPGDQKTLSWVERLP